MTNDIIVLFFDKIVNYVVENRKKVIRYIIIGLCLLVLFILWKSFAFVMIDIKDSTNGKGDVTYYSNMSADPVPHIGNIAFVSRQTKSVTAKKSDYIQSEVALNIPWYNIDTVKIPLSSDVNSTKVSYENTTDNPCATFNQSSEALLSYDCINSVALVKHDTSTDYWKNDLVNDLQIQPSTAKPYNGGVIGFNGSLEQSKAINYYDGTGKVQVWNAPSDINIAKFNQSTIVVDSLDSADKNFLIVTPDGDIYLATPGTTSVSYIRFKAPKGYDSSHQQTACSMNSTMIYCYRGNIRGELGDINKEKAINPTISIIENRQSAQMKILSVDKQSLDGICVTTDGSIYGTEDNTIYSLSKENNQFLSKVISANGIHATCGDRVYFIQNNGIMSFRDGVSSRIFYSPNITPSSLYVTNTSTYILGQNTGINGTTFAYRLDTSKDTNPGNRLIDIYPNQNITSVADQDMVGSTIYASVGITHLNNDNYTQKKDQTLGEMRSLGIDVDNLDVKIVY